MLDPDALDIDALCAALDDRSPGTVWFVHGDDGRIVTAVPFELSGVGSGFDDPVWHRIEGTVSGAGYRDMAEFVAGVHHRRAAELLDRAISGRGAFRRFKDTLVEFPDLREGWFRFRDARARRRALWWLVDQGLVERGVGLAALERHPDPVGDTEADVPSALAVDLRMQYGDRLERVLVCGAWARGEPADEALELLVVLRDLTAPWVELAAMDDVLWHYAEQAGQAVVAVPVSEAQLADPDDPVLCRLVVGAVMVA